VEDAAAGVCVSVQLDRWDVDHRAAMIGELQSLGVRTIRHDLRWDYTERARGTWDWTTEDAWMAAATDGGFTIIAMLGYGNAWASSDPAADAFYPPDDPADFANFATEAALRYGDRIDRWEIWNEPNAGYRFWKVGDPPAIGGDPAGYAALFVPAAAALHDADPGAEVQIGGTFFHSMAIPGGPEFVGEAAAAEPDFLASADALAWHPYTLYPPRVGPEVGGGGETPIWEMAAEMSAAAPGLPLVITEVGWPEFEDVDAELQAAYTLRAFALAQAEGNRDVCVYTLEDGSNPENPEEAFGLYAYGTSTPEPVGAALGELAATIAGLDTNGRAEAALGLPDGVYAVRWSSGQATATLVWAPDADIEVTIPASEGGCGADTTVRATDAPVWVTETPCR
jgi:hypothetical protein